MKYIKLSLQLFFLIICAHLHAQVPVIKEPHHKPVFVNSYVRLLDVHIKPGDTTLYHIHAAPSVMVHISNSLIGSQIMGDAITTPSQVMAGQTRFAAYDEKPITHRVFNAGKNIFHVMDIELVKKNPSPDSCSVLQQNNVQTTINEKLVRVYKFDVNIQPFIIPKTNCAHLLVCVSGAINALNKKLRTGDYAFFNPQTKILINNRQSKNATCVLLELK